MKAVPTAGGRDLDTPNHEHHVNNVHHVGNADGWTNWCYHFGLLAPGSSVRPNHHSDGRDTHHRFDGTDDWEDYPQDDGFSPNARYTFQQDELELILGRSCTTESYGFSDNGIELLVKLPEVGDIPRLHAVCLRLLVVYGRIHRTAR